MMTTFSRWIGFSMILLGIMTTSLDAQVKSTADWGTLDAETAHPSRLLIKVAGDLADTDGVTQSLNSLHRAVGVRSVKSLNGIPWEVVELQHGVSLAYAAERYIQSRSVLYVEPDYVVHGARTPNDPDYGELWGMPRIGAPDAWDLTTGNTNIVVGVIDSGILLTHEDLIANIWENPGEIPDDGIDNDGNGYVDDVSGWNFINESNDPTDDHGHGTHVSGTIGAVGNNGTGVAGVNWQVKLVGLKFLNSNNTGFVSDAIEAVLYAAGLSDYIKLTCNSWGGGGYNRALVDAIAEARRHNQLFIAAAGNNSDDLDETGNIFYPAQYADDNLISVASIEASGDLSGFSNYGVGDVDLAAPGGGIWSLGIDGDDSYTAMSGTSMATPHVAGAAALLWGLEPLADYTVIRDALLENVILNPTLSGKVKTGGELHVGNALATLIKPLEIDQSYVRSDANIAVRVQDVRVMAPTNNVLVAWAVQTSTELVRDAGVLSLAREGGGPSFKADLVLGVNAVAADGDQVTFTYQPIGSSTSATALAVVDDTPPALQSFDVKTVTESYAMVDLMFDEPVLSTLSVDTQLPPSSIVVSNAAMASQVSLTINGLKALSKYFVSVEATDRAGNTTNIPTSSASVNPEDYLGFLSLVRSTDYQEDFEQDDGGWHINHELGTTGWEYGIFRYGPENPGRGWATVVDGPYSNATQTVLTSPVFTVGNSPEIKLWTWYEIDANELNFTELGRIEVLRDGVWYDATGYAELWEDGQVFGSSGGWKMATILLPEAFANQVLQVRLRFVSDAQTVGLENGAGWYLDEVAVTSVRESRVMLKSLEVDDGPSGNQLAEPGETVALTLDIVNVGETTLTNVSVSVDLFETGSAVSAELNHGADYEVLLGDMARGSEGRIGPINLTIPSDIDVFSPLLLELGVSASPSYSEVLTAVLEVLPSASITGQIIDASTLDVVTNALVWVSRGGVTTTNMVGADGQFAIQGLIPDRLYEVTAAGVEGTAYQRNTINAHSGATNLILGLPLLSIDISLLESADVPSFYEGEPVKLGLKVSSTNSTIPAAYRLFADASTPRAMLPVISPESGVLLPGGETNVWATLQSVGLEPGLYPVTLSVVAAGDPEVSDDVLGTFTIRARSDLTFDRAAVQGGGNWWLTPGVMASLNVSLSNQYELGAAEDVVGILTLRDPAQGHLSTNRLFWSKIAEIDSAFATDALDFTPASNLVHGAKVWFDLSVSGADSNRFAFSFALTNYTSQAMTGQVSHVRWPDSGLTNGVTVVPLSNAVIRAELIEGSLVGEAKSGVDGTYAFSELPATTLWFYAQAPAEPPVDTNTSEKTAWPLFVAPAGQYVDVTQTQSATFVFHDYGAKAPFPVIDYQFSDAVHGNTNGIFENDERFRLEAEFVNQGGSAAIGVTGWLASVYSSTLQPVRVESGNATKPMNLNSLTVPRVLTPAPVLRVAADAPRGALQRFVVYVSGTNAFNGQSITWPFNIQTRIDSQYRVSGVVRYSGVSAAEAEVLHAETVVRLELGDHEEIVKPDAIGRYAFESVPEGTGSVAIVQVPLGYVAPPRQPVSLDGFDANVDFDVLASPVTLDGTNSAGLHVTLTEGTGTNGAVLIHNTGMVSRTLYVDMVYQRQPYEVSTPSYQLDAASEPVVPPPLNHDWSTVDASKVIAEDLIVRFDEHVTREDQLALLAAHGLDPVFFLKSSHAWLARRSTSGGQLSLSSGAVLAESMEQNPSILLVMPDQKLEKQSVTTPNDPLFGEMFGLWNRGQTGGSWGEGIRAPLAWNETTGSRDVVVAICDTGIQTDHPDLAANIWENPSPGTSDGVTNDLHGWNVANWNADITDLDGHGTHVAGTIGAVGDNAKGVVGVNWNVQLMGVRLTDDSGGFASSARLAKSIEYAVENGARVSNHSWGGPDAAGVIYEAIRYARDHNHLVVTAAGNSGRNLDEVQDNYPQGYSRSLDNIIVVAAADHDGELAYFSDFGEASVHLAAPGYRILSTYSKDALSMSPPLYEVISGTSMASPHVAGVAGLLWSLVPDASYRVIRDAILRGVRHEPNLQGWVATSGHLDAYGAILALGPDWVSCSQTSLTLSAGASTSLWFHVNEPAELRARYQPYRAYARLVDNAGQEMLQVPVSANVLPGVWLDVDQVDLHDEAGRSLQAAAAGETVEVVVTIKNRGAAAAINLSAELSGGAGSQILSNRANVATLYGGEAAMLTPSFRVTTDPSATNDLVFDLTLSVNGQLAGTHSVTVPLVDGYTLRGRVLAARDQQPLADAVVEVIGETGAQVIPDPDGHFMIRGLRDGDYRLRAYALTNRVTDMAFSIAGAFHDMGNVYVYAPAVQAGVSDLPPVLLQGGERDLSLQLTHNGVAADGAFDYRIQLAPQSRLALVSDGDTLGDLVAPLEHMGFEVDWYTNNFARIHVDDNTGNRIVQDVRYTEQASFFASYQAVIADIGGNNGAGRLLNSTEKENYERFLSNGGLAVLTGANPLTGPDNHELAALLGSSDLQRQTSRLDQAIAEAAFESPFITITGSLYHVATDLMAYDRATTYDSLSVTMFAVGSGHKLLGRAYPEHGQLYVWGGNEADADWDKAGVWRDVLRGILWNSLIEGHEDAVYWLNVIDPTSLQGRLAVGESATVNLSLAAGYPLPSGMADAVAVILGENGETIALNLDVGVLPGVVEVFTSGRVTDSNAKPLRGDGGTSASLYQVILVGTNGIVAPPATNGAPGSGNRLLGELGNGLPHGRFGSGAVMADSGRFQQQFRLGETVGTNIHLFVRAWDGATIDEALTYGDSALFTLVPDRASDGLSQDFGSWTVNTLIDGAKDSNGDGLSDAWMASNRPDLNPAAPITALTGTASVVYSTNLNHIGANPTRVCMTTNFLYVLDTENNRVVVISPTNGTIAGYIPASGDGVAGTAIGRFAQPQGMALDSRGGVDRLVIADTANHRIQVLTLDPTSGLMASGLAFGSQGGGNGLFEYPKGVAVMPGVGDIFVADTGNNRVQVFSGTGSFRWSFDGGISFSLNAPQGIAADLNIGVFVADTGNDRIMQFTPTGTELSRFGSTGATNGAFYAPSDVQVWRQDNGVARLVVADQLNSRVQILSSGGNFIAKAGLRHGSLPGELRLPYGVFPVAGTNVIYVADTGNRRIQAFTPVMDADGDGMDDAWEDANGLDSTINDAFADADTDGVTNVGEYIAGTDPQDASSVPEGLSVASSAFKIVGMNGKGVDFRLASDGGTDGDPFVLSWQSDPGRRYRIEFSEPGSEMAWETVATITASDAESDYALPARRGFYRIVRE